jgi:hypothetical protein
MIDAGGARRAAELELGGPLAQLDPQFAAIHEGSLGEPMLVRDLSLRPSYWLVPIARGERVVGFARVLPTGQVAAVGTFCRDPARLEDCPRTVTGVTADEAEGRAAARVDAEAGERASPPVFVHDGPPGREAWLVRVSSPGRGERLIFVSSGTTYERPAGEPQNADME